MNMEYKMETALFASPWSWRQQDRNAGILPQHKISVWIFTAVKAS